jgi:beta-galactosidase/beta-glucuronidase
MYPHRIRLRGPWECIPLLRGVVQSGGYLERTDAPVPDPFTITLPCRWGEGGLSDFSGRVRFRRRFHWPGRIDAHERLWLTFAGVEGTAEIWLNGNFLGRDGTSPVEFDVTSWIRIRNDLLVEVTAADDNGGLWGEVALEVRCLAYLRDVQASLTAAADAAELHVSGSVVGTSDRPLDLYVLLDGATIIYTTVEPSPAGHAFHLLKTALGTEVRQGEHTVSVELVNGASVWFVAEPLVDYQGLIT